MSARITKDGTVLQLDRRPEPDEHISADTVQDKVRLSKFLLQLFLEVSKLRRRWWPERLDFEQTVTGDGTTPHTIVLRHGFGGPVTWWVVRVTNASTDVTGLSTTAIAPFVTESSSSDDNALYLTFYYSADVTIRVEQSG